MRSSEDAKTAQPSRQSRNASPDAGGQPHKACLTQKSIGFGKADFKQMGCIPLATRSGKVDFSRFQRLDSLNARWRVRSLKVRRFLGCGFGGTSTARRNPAAVPALHKPDMADSEQK